MRAYFDEGVSKQDNMKVQQKRRSAFVIQASKRIEEAAEKMDWETKVKVVTIFPDDATMKTMFLLQTFVHSISSSLPAVIKSLRRITMTKTVEGLL